MSWATETKFQVGTRVRVYGEYEGTVTSLDVTGEGAPVDEIPIFVEYSHGGVGVIGEGSGYFREGDLELAVRTFEPGQVVVISTEILSEFDGFKAVVVSDDPTEYGPYLRPILARPDEYGFIEFYWPREQLSVVEPEPEPAPESEPVSEIAATVESLRSLQAVAYSSGAEANIASVKAVTLRDAYNDVGDLAADLADALTALEALS